MVKKLVWIFVAGILLTACSKEPTIPTEGEIVLNSKLFGTGPYYPYGFLFSQAKKVSTLSSPPPDITVIAETDLAGNVTGASISTTGFLNSFHLVGGFQNLQEAETAFNNLKEVTTPVWIAMAQNIEPFQVYLFRTRNDTYAKFMIMELIVEKRDNLPFAEVRIKWMYQPNGSNIFP